MRWSAIVSGLVASLSAAAVACTRQDRPSFDVLGLAATVDGNRAEVQQQMRGPKRPRTFTGPEAPWLVPVDRVRYVPGTDLQRLHLTPPERPSPSPVDVAPAALAPRKARVVVAFTVRALDPELVQLEVAPRGMVVEVSGVRTAVPRDGRVELALEHDLGSPSPIPVVFHPAGATLELVIGPGW